MSDNAHEDCFSDSSITCGTPTREEEVGVKTPIVRHASNSSMEIRAGGTITEVEWQRSRGSVALPHFPAVPPYPVELVGRLPKIAEGFVRVMQEQFVHRLRTGEEMEPSKSRFRRKTVPAISLLDYVVRICNYVVALEPVMLLAVLTYAKVLDPPEGRGAILIDSYSVHRFVITGVCVASKALGDHYYSNAFYAKVGGISTGELNHLEFELVEYLNWRLQCPTEEVQRCWEDISSFLTGAASQFVI